MVSLRFAMIALALSAAGQEQTPLTPERRADILMARKMYREAVEVYRQDDIKNAVILNKIGIAYHQMLQLGAAKKYYEQALRVKPTYPEAINNIGTIYYAQKSYRKAIGYYRRALASAPQSASIYSNLGTAYFARKKYPEAVEAYQKALSLDPEVFEHKSTYGVMLQERTVEERAKYNYFLAKMYAKAGRTELALQHIRKALEEGFREKKKLREEPDFAALQELPEFKELLKLEPRVL
jgi:tetratricopeptide (TPR) repeat protein